VQPPLDACGAHLGVTPDSNGVAVVHCDQRGSKPRTAYSATPARILALTTRVPRDAADRPCSDVPAVLCRLLHERRWEHEHHRLPCPVHGLQRRLHLSLDEPRHGPLSTVVPMLGPHDAV
jgi:hypothetical protein